MKINNRFKTILLIFSIILLFGLVGFGSFYTYWNSASPYNTCASCHEIELRVESHANSSHQNLTCKECHGTALSNGFHSLKEKGMMVVNHVRKTNIETIRMNEEQMLDVMNNCERCHTAEYANWKSGGHSMTYGDVFLNEKHNTTEQINFDCLRCHGMFSSKSVDELVEPLKVKGPWKLKDKELMHKSAIPCMACHQIHQEGKPKSQPDYANPQEAFYNRKAEKPGLTFFDRHEKININVVDLPKLKLTDNNLEVAVSDDPIMRNCVQCHAPNAAHLAGTSDDRTPRGVHEGLSCTACHEPHSNDARNSCSKCHPPMTNCNLDVTQMNTTFKDKNSKNDIHFVSCTDCHKADDPRLKSKNLRVGS